MKVKGFTLIELLVTLALLAILIAIALPSFHTSITQQKVKTARNDLMSAFQYARTEAVTQNRSVSICASENPWAAIPTCSYKNDWSTGWIVFKDDSANLIPGIVKPILRGYSNKDGIDINYTREGGGSVSWCIRYIATGMTDTLFSHGTFVFSDPQNKVPSRSVIIGPTTGQARIGS